MWAQVINALLGIWLMAAPSVLKMEGTAADNDHIVGPLIATVAITAIFENARNLRLVNVLFGAWLLVVPWVLDFPSTTAIIAHLVTGAVVIGLSLVKGEVKEKVGGGWASLWKNGKADRA